ncbi:hypothetical protein [Endothiovibrio diazotrophicus]
MQPLRQIYEDAPDSIPVPEALRHRRIELILWPLDEDPESALPARPAFAIADVERVEIPSREERNARRSEDLQHQQRIEGLTIINPFAS